MFIIVSFYWCKEKGFGSYLNYDPTAIAGQYALKMVLIIINGLWDL
jgi:hypothetical protein